ncbi:amidohydrolase [Nocardia sp. NPDC001965]
MSISANILKRRVCDDVDRIATTLVDLSHRIHSNPELAFREHRASAWIADLLRAEGIAVEQPAFGIDTAFCTEFGPSGGPKVAVVSEYDALPDIGHGCGHNIIAAIGLGAALALHGLGNDLPGAVRYLGTPAEERGCGKEAMALAGAWDGVDAAMMLHPANVDMKAVRTQYLADATVVFRGHTAHAALAADAVRSSLDAVVLAYQAIAQLQAHMKPSERVTGVITEGGAVPNVLPDAASSAYYVRAASTADLAVLKRRVEACLQAAAAATGCELELSWGEFEYRDMRINEPLADTYQRNAETFGRVFTPYENYPIGGSDMSNVSHRVPVLHGIIASTDEHVQLHTRAFTATAVGDTATRAVIEGSKALAMTAIDFLTDKGLRESVYGAFAGQRGRIEAPL